MRERAIQFVSVQFQCEFNFSIDSLVPTITTKGVSNGGFPQIQMSSNIFLDCVLEFLSFLVRKIRNFNELLSKIQNILRQFVINFDFDEKCSRIAVKTCHRHPKKFEN